MDHLSYDVEMLEKDLLEDSARLFMDDHESFIQVIAASGSRRSFCLPDSGHTDTRDSVLPGRHDKTGRVSRSMSSHSIFP